MNSDSVSATVDSVVPIRKEDTLAKDSSKSKAQKKEKPVQKKKNVGGKPTRGKKKDSTPTNATIQLVVAKPVEKEEKPVEKKLPELTTGDVYRAMQQCIGNVTTLYEIIPVKFLGLDTPAMVRDHPFTELIPLVYRFDYKIVSEEVAKIRSPYVLARRTEYHFGEEQDSVDVLIEPKLILRAFDTSTVRSLRTLVDSVFMQVNRGLGDSVKPDFDVNTKLEAIAALYAYRHPNLETSLDVFYRVMAHYKPTVPGVYALGGIHTPDFGEAPVEVKWKQPRDPVAQHYVLRLLDPSLEGIVYPLYCPARTPEEFLKGMAKRLKSPPRITHTIRGIEWNQERVEHLLRDVSMMLVEFMRPRMAQVPTLCPEEILEECEKHARFRFTSPSDRNDYYQGAKIAIFEEPSSKLFLRMLDLCVEIGVFPKDETYDKYAPIRFIMCPQIAARGFCHALLMNVQRRLFGIDKATHNQFSIKHMPEDERRKFVLDFFGTTPVANGDISSMESSVTAMHMRNIEWIWFMACCHPAEQEKLNALWNVYTSRQYHVSCKEYSFNLDPMRLSGQEHTSAGNWVVNFTWINAIIYMLSGEMPDLHKFKILCEGDDSLYTKVVPLVNGTEYEIDPVQFIMAAESIGTKQKLQVFDNVDDASFCGIKLKPCRRQLPNGNSVPDHCIDYDADFVLSKIFWKAGYDRSTAKHDSEIAYASILSYLPRVQGNKDLYDALYWKAKQLQPSLRTTQSKNFHSIWLHTFYKGEVDEVPTVPTDLASYCDKHGLPNITFPPFYKPTLFSTPMENRYNMEIVHVKGPTVASTWDSFIHFFRPGREKILVDESNECMIHAMHEYYKMTGQLNPDLPDWNYDIFKQVRFPDTKLPTLAQVKEAMAPGETLAVDHPKGCEVFTCKDDGVVESQSFPTISPLRIRVRNNWFTNYAHAVVIGPNQEEEPDRKIGAGEKLFIIPIVLCLLALVWWSWSGVALFTVVIWDVPLYCFWKIGKVVWQKWGADWVEDKLGPKATLVKPAAALAGASLGLILWRFFLTIGVIIFLCWLFWDYIGGVILWLLRKGLELLLWLWSQFERLGAEWVGIILVCVFVLLFIVGLVIIF